MSRRTRTGWIVLVVLGTLATVGSAAFGLLLLRAYLVRDEPLDDSSPLRATMLATGGQGPLLGLRPGQRAELRYRSEGCFHHVDKKLVFVRDDDGRMILTVSTMRTRAMDSVEREVLDEAEVWSYDRKLLHAQHAGAGRCTTRDEYDLAIFEGMVELRRSHFVDDSCANRYRTPALIR